MTSIPSSSSDAGTYSSESSDTESSTTNYGHIADEPVHFTYQSGVLSWQSYSLKDADIIATTRVEGSNIGHTILSLSPDSQPFELRTTNTTLLPKEFLDRHLLESLPVYLQPDHAIYVLISTLSGTGLAPSFFDEVLHPLTRALSLNYVVVRTSSAESVGEFARSTLLPGANGGKKQTVLMLSGDGGMVDTINGLLGSGEQSSTYTPPILSQLPLGTGNALFHSLHKTSPLPSLYIQGLRTLLHGTPHALPTFRCTFSPGSRLLTNGAQTATPIPNNALYGAVVASYGLHATLVADSDTPEYRTHGASRFGLVANDLLFPKEGTPHAYKAQLSLDGKLVERKEHGYILLSLVSNLEKTFTISPASKALDGILRVVHFGPLTGTETMEVMKAAYDNGKHVTMPEVGYETVEKVRIEFQEGGESWKWRRCCVDGLIVGVEEGGWVEVEREVRRVVDIVFDGTP